MLFREIHLRTKTKHYFFPAVQEEAILLPILGWNNPNDHYQQAATKSDELGFGDIMLN